MSDLVALEQRFWSKVWQCMHRRPCKKCCWPWKSIDVSANFKQVWQEHATFVDKALPQSPIAAYRAAYEFIQGSLTLRTRAFPLCHQCHFGPCCNPWHVLPGAVADNIRDKRHAKDQRVILLPDGQRWSYTEACVRQSAFYEALRFQRVWAGPIPQTFKHMEQGLFRPPRRSEWPGRQEASVIGISWEKMKIIQRDLAALAAQYGVSLQMLGDIATIDSKQ